MAPLDHLAAKRTAFPVSGRLLTATLVALGLLLTGACDGRPDPDGSDLSRYQISGTVGGFWLFDTKTGDIWACFDGQWTFVGRLTAPGEPLRPQTGTMRPGEPGAPRESADGRWRSPPTMLEKQKQALGEVRSLATAVESYAIDTKQFPVVSGSGPVSRLRPYLEPIYVRHLFRVDPWGGEYLYNVDPTGQDYAIRSYGSDGVASGPTAGPTTDFRHDIIFANGAFVTWPEGPQE